MATNTQRRRELNFANDLAAFAAKSFDLQTKREIYSVVYSIRKRYGFSWQQKIEEVWHAMTIGASTQIDIEKETHFKHADVTKILVELEQMKMISFQLLKRANSAGRPVRLIVRLRDKLDLCTPKS